MILKKIILSFFKDVLKKKFNIQDNHWRKVWSDVKEAINRRGRNTKCQRRIKSNNKTKNKTSQKSTKKQKTIKKPSQKMIRMGQVFKKRIRMRKEVMMKVKKKNK